MIYGTLLDPGEAVEHAVPSGRRLYVYVARGTVELNGQALGAGDGAELETEPAARLAGVEPAEVLLFDLP